MGMSQKEGKMEGWLYVIRSNRIGLQCSRKRFFVLEGNYLNSFKEMATYKNKDPSRSAVIDSCIRITENGRVNIHRKVFYMFTLYNVLNHDDRLKLGATSSEEAASWICSFKEALSKECTEQITSTVACSKRKQESLRLSQRRGTDHMKYAEFQDWTHCLSTRSDPMTSDVIAPSSWTIFGCQNGLRLFKETKDSDFQGKNWDDHPAVMAVGVVDATSETIFQTLMSLGLSRSEWDFCFYRGRVIEHLDGHTDIIHKQLNSDWLPWGMKRRDLLLRRYWRREDDGTYVILYHSVFHRNCLPQRGYIRACLKSGGYVISPVNQGKQSVVKHMLAMDWRFWKSYLFTSSAKSVTIRMLGRVAAIRELFRAKMGSCIHSTFNSYELTREIGLSQGEREHIKVEVQEENIDNQNLTDEQRQSSPNRISNLAGSFLQLNDTMDEFFDVPEESESETPENSWTSNSGLEMHSQAQDLHHGKLSTAASFVKKLHELAVQKRGYMDLQGMAREDSMCCSYGTTLPKDQTCTLPCSWAETDPSTFLIRGKNYLHDHQKVKATGTLFQMVAADWLRSDKREDDLGGRHGSIVQKYAEQGGHEFFFIVNIQVPGSTTHNLVLYYILDSPVEDIPLLHSFIKGDDAYRNSRFKLIPYISTGSWIVKQSVGKKACLVGQALDLNYFQGSNYLEIDVDVGSSTVARGVISLVLGYLNNLVIEMAFLLQANTEEELPEALLGTCRLNQLDASKSVLVKPY
ncbi:protein ENHANCED DISEASE RESISTANCE 2-like [Aristolochia californica]|uniref:protein ENHANCED DISEASE RESISTANCE 2-like n=1 Tax=Aristolochia californica TaxID=171875 RepID=UPI0035DAD170